MLTNSSNGLICKTKQQTTNSTPCGGIFDAWNWDKYQELNITTKSEQRIMNEYTAIVRLSTTAIYSDDLWNGYLLPDFKVSKREQ